MFPYRSLQWHRILILDLFLNNFYWIAIKKIKKTNQWKRKNIFPLLSICLIGKSFYLEKVHFISKKCFLYLPLKPNGKNPLFLKGNLLEKHKILKIAKTSKIFQVPTINVVWKIWKTENFSKRFTRKIFFWKFSYSC